MTRILLFILSISFFSINLFSQWTQVPSAPKGFIRNIIDYNDTIYLAHSNSGVYRSVDGMNSWEQLINGLTTSFAKQVYEVKIYNDFLFAASVDGIFKSTDKGNTWIEKNNGITIGPGALKIFAESVYEHNGTLFAGVYNGIYRSTDWGESWLNTNVSGQAAIPKNFIQHNGILFAARETINFPAGYKSFDDGLTWESIPNQPFGSIITFFSEPGKLWAGTIFGVWVSTNNGSNWEQRDNGLSADPYSASIIRVNGDLYTSLKFGGSGVFRSTNEGLNWEDFSDGLPFLNQIDKLIYYDNKIIATTTDGLWWRELSPIPVELISFTSELNTNYISLKWATASENNNRGFEVERSEMADNKWQKIGFVEGFGTTTEIKSYSYKDENIIPGIYKYRLKQIDFNGSFEYSKVIEVEIGIPSGFSLSQNYPNPFNPTTKIKYSVPANVTPRGVDGSHITIKIYDLLGNEIATLVNELKPAGTYEIEFDASELGSGVYYYQLKTEEFVKTRKMLLLK